MVLVKYKLKGARPLYWTSSTSSSLPRPRLTNQGPLVASAPHHAPVSTMATKWHLLTSRKATGLVGS